MAEVALLERRERRAWFFVAGWILFIYGSIPLARALQEWLSGVNLRDVFLWVTYASFIAAALAVAVAIARRRIVVRRTGLIVLAVVLGIFSWQTWTLRRAPEEAFHFVQYGGLALLLFYALQFRHRDFSIYLIAIAMGSVAGAMDELIQWVTPRRFFDFRDIRLNITAGVLTQIGLAWGVRPPGIAMRIEAAGLARTCRYLALLSALYAFALVNTPALKAWYSGFLPVMKAVPTATAEYGYRHALGDVGAFYSRLTLPELAAMDQQRGAEAAARLDPVRTDEEYIDFIRQNPTYQDPYLVEARAHIFRRDRYRRGIKDPSISESERLFRALVAYRENQILEQFFPTLLAHSEAHRWSESLRTWVAEQPRQEAFYVSAVSRHLFVRWPRSVMAGGPAVLALVLVGVAAVLRRRG
jgi:hypothetical protein